MRFISVFFCLVLVGCSGVGSSVERSANGGMLDESAAVRPLSASQQTFADTNSYSILHTFSTQSGGNFPASGLTADYGVLYGTTVYGGNGYGTIFGISTSGTEHTLYNFSGGGDGAYPVGDLINVNGTLYGTASGGGGPAANGSVFSIQPSGSLHVIHQFSGGADGANPTGALTYLNGSLYGTTSSGGTGTACGDAGCGTVFEVGVSPSSETVLYSFQGGTDGANPHAGLTFADNTFYGVTYSGGSGGFGTAFSITASGKEKVLYSFKGGSADGAGPVAGLTFANGMFYGTTSSGGPRICEDGMTCGTIFTLTTSGSESVLYDNGFGGNGGPQASLIYVNGRLLSTTRGEGGGGDGAGCGSIFSTSTSGDFRLLHTFQGHGCEPESKLTYFNGAFYGTTTGAVGAHTINGGTVFKLQLHS